MTNTLHQWLFGNKKNYWHRETTLGFAAPPPFHPCVLERGCRKHNTNGSGITLNIQMGKLIVYAWIHRCDYLAPLASLLRSLKATPSAFCFHLPPLKKKKKKVWTTRRDSDAEVQRREFISINVFLLFFFFLLFVAVPTCDRCAGCRAVSVTNTLSEERVSNDKRGGRFCHLTAAANEQKSQWLLHQRCHFVHVTTWRWLLDFTRENIKTSETKKISLLLLQIFSNFYLFIYFFGHSCRSSAGIRGVCVLDRQLWY